MTAKADEVTSVDPAEGASVTLDTPIKVFYATGMGLMPSLTGISEEDARRVAKNAGFSKVDVDKVESTNPVGVIFEQDPPVGSNVKRTTTIKLKTAVAAPTAPPSTPAPSPSPTATA